MQLQSGQISGAETNGGRTKRKEKETRHSQRNCSGYCETKRNETKRNETKRNETKRNETKRNETRRNETKRNETKRNETKRFSRSFLSLFLAASVCIYIYMQQSINRACVAQTQKSSTPVRESTGLSLCVASYSRRVARGASLLHMHTSAVRRCPRTGVWIKGIKDLPVRESVASSRSVPFGSSPLHARTTGQLSSASSTSHTLCFSYCARYHFYCRREARVPLSVAVSLVPPPSLFFPSVLFYFPPLFFSFSPPSPFRF